MREIKFRGFREQDEKWIYGSLVELKNGEHFILEKNDIERDGHHVMLDMDDMPTWFDEKSFGQYTGLNDKNGVEIYEGDIVKQTFEIYRYNYYEEDFSLYGNDVGEVVLIPSKGACMKNIIRNAIENEEIETKDEKLKIHKNVVSSRCEVIGNIWENPELLKSELPRE